MLKTEEVRKIIAEGKGCYIPMDVLELYHENEEARENLKKEGVRNLYCAVCYRSVEDYENACKNVGSASNYARLKQAKQHKIDLEKFFESEFWRMVTHVDKEQTMRAIERNMKRKAMKKMAV